MKHSLMVLFLGSTLSLFGAVDRKLHLDPAPTGMHEHIARISYQKAKDAIGGELTGTVAEFYAAIIKHGYQNFLDNNPDIEQRTLEIMDIFQAPVSEKKPLVKAAVDAYACVLNDPQNIDLWLQELEAFSDALIDLARSLVTLPSFKALADVTQRLIDNNGVSAEPKQRIEMVSCMVAVTARFTQRYLAMGAEAFEEFKKRAPEVIQRLAQKQQSVVVASEVYAYTSNE
jgi:hypothetical protein